MQLSKFKNITLCLRGATKTKYWITFWILLFISGFLFIVSLQIFQPLSSSQYALHVDEGRPSFGFVHQHDSTSETISVISESSAGISLDIQVKKKGYYKIDVSSKAVDPDQGAPLSFSLDGRSADKIPLANKGKSFYESLKRNGTISISSNGNKIEQINIRLKRFSGSALLISFTSLLLWVFILQFTYRKNQAAYTIACYFVFLLLCYAESVTFGTVLPRSVLSYTVALFTITVALSLLFNLFVSLKIPRWLAISPALILFLIAISPLIFISYKLSFGIPMEKDALYAIFQSNLEEGIDFIQDFISLTAISVFTIALAILLFILWWHRNSQVKKIVPSKWMILLILSSLLSADYAKDMRLPRLITKSLSEYKNELKQFEALKRKRNVEGVKAIAKQKKDLETIVVILGESLNKNHMQLYGYHRNTTPHLQRIFDEGNLLKFENAYSNHTHTMPALSLALTEAAQDKKKNYYESASILEVFRAANFKTYWLSNQNLMGAWDNLVSILAQQADTLTGINRSIGRTTQTQQLDGALVPLLAENLNAGQEEHELFFVHLMGSHSNYCSRFDEQHNKYGSKLQAIEYGNAANNDLLSERLNCYDNSVYYNDFIVSSIIELVEQKRKNSIVIYIPDHSEDVINLLAHNSAQFTYTMTEIPFLIWFSAQYRSAHEEIIKNLERNTELLFPNDRLYDTLIGIAEIDTEHYRPGFDLSASSYHINDSEAFTLHGKKLYTAPENHQYWQRKNHMVLSQTELARRLTPNAVQTIGKLSQASQLGYQIFELILDFGDSEDLLLFANETKHNLSLEDWLQLALLDEEQQLLINLTALDRDDVEKAITSLESLSSLLNLKDKIMLEFDKDSVTANLITNGDWKIIHRLSPKNMSDKPKLINDISNNKITDISFDLDLYPIIKNELEPLLPKDTKYHVRTSESLSDQSFVEKLKKLGLQNDDSIVTLRFNLISAYNL